MRAGELKEFLSDLPDQMEVTVADGKGFLVDIGLVDRTITTEYESSEEVNVIVLYPMFVKERETE